MDQRLREMERSLPMPVGGSLGNDEPKLIQYLAYRRRLPSNTEGIKRQLKEAKISVPKIKVGYNEENRFLSSWSSFVEGHWVGVNDEALKSYSSRTEENEIFFTCLKYLGQKAWKCNRYGYQQILGPCFLDLYTNDRYFMKASHFGETYEFSYGGYLIGHFAFWKSGDYARSVRMLEAAINYKAKRTDNEEEESFYPPFDDTLEDPIKVEVSEAIDLDYEY